MKFELNGVEVIPSEAEGFVSAIAGVLVVAAIVVALLAIVMYVLKSLGLYAIAKRRGIGCAWLAWLPIGCEWITASIADNYRKVTTGKATIRRFIVVALAVVSIGLSAVATSSVTTNLEEIQEIVEYTESFGDYMDEDDAMEILEDLGEIMGGFTLMTVLAAVVGFVSKVYWYVSAGDVYASCCPKKATMMLVLSFFMPVLEPFFFFCNKEKDAGMISAGQSRQPAQPAYFEAPQPVYQAPQQPVYQAPQQPVYQAPVDNQQPVWEAPPVSVDPWEDTALLGDSNSEPWSN